MPFDCEVVGGGLFAQPVNTITSLAFLVGAVVVVRTNRLAGVTLALVGIGSIGFHGFPSAAASVLHELALVAVVVLAARALWHRRRSLPWVPLTILVAGLGIWFISRTGGAWCDPESLIQGHGVWHLLAATGLAALLAGGTAEHAAR